MIRRWRWSSRTADVAAKLQLGWPPRPGVPRTVSLALTRTFCGWPHSHRPVPAQHDRPLWPSDSSTRRSFACSAGWTSRPRIRLPRASRWRKRCRCRRTRLRPVPTGPAPPRPVGCTARRATDDGQPAAALSAELTTAADALRRRIASPSSFPHPFPQEYTLLTVSRLLDAIAHAGPTPSAAAWQRVVDIALEIARHIQRNSP